MLKIECWNSNAFQLVTKLLVFFLQNDPVRVNSAVYKQLVSVCVLLIIFDIVIGQVIGQYSPTIVVPNTPTIGALITLQVFSAGKHFCFDLWEKAQDSFKSTTMCKKFTKFTNPRGASNFDRTLIRTTCLTFLIALPSRSPSNSSGSLFSSFSSYLLVFFSSSSSLPVLLFQFPLFDSL